MQTDGSPAATVYDEVKAERKRHDAKWGGPEHDDKAHLIYDYISLANNAAVYGHPLDGEPYRTRMLQVAALAVAAIESYDRQHQKSEPSHA